MGYTQPWWVNLDHFPSRYDVMLKKKVKQKEKLYVFANLKKLKKFKGFT